MDKPIMTAPRRKTLDISRLHSTSGTQMKEKRYSFDQSPLRSNDTSVKLAFIEQSLKALKAETNPLSQASRQGLRPLTGSPLSTKSTKWFHKNDTADLREGSTVEKSMPPRYQRRHRGPPSALETQDKERKSKQLGGSTVFFTVLALVAVIAVNYWFIKDFQKGMCTRNLTLNMTSLNATLKEQVFGQHLAVDLVPSLVYDHMVPLETKPLVSTFLGWTGVGKNYVTSIIADHIRTKKRTVHEYIVPLHFPHENSGRVYTELVQQWVIGNLSSCAINLVIIDELEKASTDVMQGLEMLLEKLDVLRLNSTRVIVLLLSSSGGIQINKLVFDHITNGRDRESLQNSDFLKVLDNTEAKWYLSMYSRGLINSIVPFLPLEKRHVARCIEQDIDQKHHTCANPHIVAKVLDELIFFPSSDPVFSAAGCRKVGTKVDLVIDSIESRHSYYKDISHEDS